jgi:uncharacterized damage-inducible protein DinB
MSSDAELVSAVFAGWRAYQETLIKALQPLQPEQLDLRAAPGLRTVGEIARHMIGARARWFGDWVGEAFADFAAWDRRGAPRRSPAELVHGLQATWDGMHQAISRWTPAEWAETMPGEYPDDPEVITRQWVIWHLIEHDLHHGGEISLTLGVHSVPALNL